MDAPEQTANRILPQFDGETLAAAMLVARPVVASILGNRCDIEDCLQDACVSALQFADSFEGAAKFSTWFTTIAKNIALMRRRRVCHTKLGQAMRHVENMDSIPRCGLNPEQIFLAKSQNAQLVDAVKGLYPASRNEILLWAVDMHEVNSGNTPKARRFRAKAALREALR